MRLSTRVLDHFLRQLDRYGFTYVADRELADLLMAHPGPDRPLEAVPLEKPERYAFRALELADTEPSVDPVYHVPPAFRVQVAG